MAITKTQRFHPLHMFLHVRSEMAAVPHRSTEGLQSFFMVSSQERLRNRRGSAASVISPDLSEGIGRDVATNDQPVEKTINPLRMQNAAGGRPFCNRRAEPLSKNSLAQFPSFFDECLEPTYNRPVLIAPFS